MANQNIVATFKQIQLFSNFNSVLMHLSAKILQFQGAGYFFNVSRLIFQIQTPINNIQIFRKKEKKQKDMQKQTNTNKQNILFGRQKSVWVKDAFLLEFLCLLLFSDHSSSKETCWCFPECFSCRPVMFTGKQALLLSSHRWP